jgi:LmbE family N-acetylglucosaminyl deacetylase
VEILNNKNMFRLMSITAHPDDESANFGGSLSLYATRGIETSAVCLTPGQAASHRGGAKTDQELAVLRRKEFASACEILKVRKPVVLDYPDGRLHRQDTYHVVCELSQLIREFRPQVIVTFGPEGGVTGHTDHSMASIFATLAFHWAGRANRYPDQLTNGLPVHQAQKLYYSTSDSPLPGYPVVVPPPLTAIIDITAYASIKLEAFRAHTSQAALVPNLEKYMGTTRKKQELYHLAATTVPVSGSPETDLFACIIEEK